MDMAARERTNVHVTGGEIEAGLQIVGVRAGDVLLVHASLTSMGYVVKRDPFFLLVEE